MAEMFIVVGPVRCHSARLFGWQHDHGLPISEGHGKNINDDYLVLCLAHHIPDFPNCFQSIGPLGQFSL